MKVKYNLKMKNNYIEKNASCKLREFLKSGFRSTAEPNFTCKPGALRRVSGYLFIKNEEIKLMLWAAKLEKKKEIQHNTCLFSKFNQCEIAEFIGQQ